MASAGGCHRRSRRTTRGRPEFAGGPADCSHNRFHHGGIGTSARSEPSRSGDTVETGVSDSKPSSVSIMATNLGIEMLTLWFDLAVPIKFLITVILIATTLASVSPRFAPKVPLPTL